MLFLAIAFLLVKFTFAQWEALKIGVLYDPRQFRFPQKHQLELKDALLDLNLMIQVRPVPEEERQMLGHKEFTKCAATLDFAQLWMFSAGGHQIKYWDRPVLNDSNVANFFIALELNGKECFNDLSLLAGAKPCFYDTQAKNRPSMSRIVVCFNNYIWRHFQSGYDLFRHELLHALGFGMLNPQSDDKRAPKPENVNWKTGPSSQQQIRNHYLDFDEQAINFVRDHFNCQKVEAILADNHETFHLNEYLFGNELMTPILSDGRNHFTYLTGSILESTHFGNVSWYKVNQQMVEEETRQYWYGKNAGCEFMEQSCYEFIQNRSDVFDGAAFPFCTKNDMAKTLSGRKLNICFSNKTHTYKVRATCQIEYELDEFDQDNEYDLKPISLNTQYSPLFRKWSQNVYGSTRDYRFCPMISRLFDGQFDAIPENGVPIKCPN